MWTELLDVDRAHSEVRETLHKTSHLLHIQLFLEHPRELNVKAILFSLSEVSETDFFKCHIILQSTCSL